MREVRIQEWCDVHWSEDEQREPATKTWVALVSERNSKTRESKIVLTCDEHAKQFADLSAFLDEYGMSIEDHGAATPAASHRDRAKTPQPGGVACPVPGCTQVSKTRNSLSKHVRVMHDAFLSQIDPARRSDREDKKKMAVPGRYQIMECPECRKSFEGPQGLGAHRRTVHKILGTSKTSLLLQKKAASG